MKAILILIFAILAFIPSIAGEDTQFTYDSTYIFRSLNEANQHPEKVFRLNLSKSKLDTFPEEIFSFKNLVELDLSKNRLEEIPSQISGLVHLRKLNLANNKLVHLPMEIGQLKELVFLGLNRNVIEDLPSTIGELEKLEILELWDNELENIPDQISELQNLKVLELRGILFTDEEMQRIDSLVVKSAKIYMSPSCNCKN